MFKSFVKGCVAAAALLGASAAAATTVEVTITNNQASGGLFLTPLFTAFHDGSFDIFDNGAAASGALEALAEEGNPGGLIAAAGAAGAATGVVLSPGGFAGAPVIDPGETAKLRLVVDEMTQRYFSFASMIIPSNDVFVANGNPLAYEVFDSFGAFTGLGPISVSRYYDAGTEVNDNLGAAFNANNPTAATDEGGTVSLLADLDFLLGQGTVAGTTVGFVPTGASPLATIQVAAVPLPASLPLLALGLFGLTALRRRAQPGMQTA